MLDEVDVTQRADVYDENGVDRSLIRWMLGLSPAERLAIVQSSIDLVQRAQRVRKDSAGGAR